MSVKYHPFDSKWGVPTWADILRAVKVLQPQGASPKERVGPLPDRPWERIPDRPPVGNHYALCPCYKQHVVADVQRVLAAAKQGKPMPEVKPPPSARKVRLHVIMGQERPFLAGQCQTCGRVYWARLLEPEECTP